ncbi:MAG: 3-dehydroquinate synthase [Gammaproteobacteria bacterium]
MKPLQCNLTQSLRLQLRDGESRIFIQPGALQNTQHLDSWTNDRDVFILCDETVARLYLDPFLERLHSRRQIIHLIPPGETSKTIEQYERITWNLVKQHFGRDMLLIGLGGGVVGDLGGFVAATYHRGVDYLLCPTTLIAQTDASVGGKTAVNLPGGKNLVGAFHHPLLVYIDPLVLRTLPPRELHAGLAEVIKYGVALDPENFEWLEGHLDGLLGFDALDLQDAIRMALTLKIAVVEADPEERLGQRAILNLGHTFGHAIETASDYRVLHGEAVAIGILMAADLSSRLGWLDTTARDRIQSLLERAHLKLTLPSLRTEDLLPYFDRDKKNRKGHLKLVLLEALGKAVLAERFDMTHMIDMLNDWPQSDWSMH